MKLTLQIALAAVLWLAGPLAFAASGAAFAMQGKTQTFTAAVSPPTTVQAKGDGSLQPHAYLLTNVGAVTAFVSCESTSALATTNAAAPPARAYPLLASTQVVIECPPNAFLTGATGSSTAVIYVTPGEGI